MHHPIGLYLHIPFCHAKCTYCSFITGSYEEELSLRYLRALNKEIETKAISLPAEERIVDTIYFGGGTPSIIAPKYLEELLHTCYQCFQVRDKAEISIEINPADISPPRLEHYHFIGINRVSMGVQSFDNVELQTLGRDHTAQDVIMAVKNLRKTGFHNISLDLIAGLPSQTDKQWQYNLTQALELHPEHLSIYLLEVKEGTTLYAQVKSGRLAKPDEDLAAEMYERLLDTTARYGYEHYEISNFAKVSANRSYYARHNLKYWLDIPYLGFGVSAHSYYQGERYWNVLSTQDYLNRIEQHGQAVAERIKLNEEDKVREAFMLQLRLMAGVNLDNFETSYGKNMAKEYEKEFAELTLAELIELEGKQLRLTRRGILLSNEVFLLFV